MPRSFQTRSKGLTQAHAFAPVPRPGRSCPSVELQHFLPSNIESISPAVDLVLRFISKFRKVDGSEASLEFALHEALTNAVVHGNHQDANKRVYLACRCSKDGEVAITVRDQGEMDEVCLDKGGAVVRIRMDANAGSASSRRSQ